ATPAATVPKREEAPAPKREESKTRESITFVATLEAVSGEARLGKGTAATGKGGPPGGRLSTRRGGDPAIRFPDGSRIELGGETLVSRLQEGPGGKSALLESGMIFVEAVKQPAGKPFVLTTAQAESTVLGTQFILAASAGTTRIDVREGRVKFTR